MLLNSDPPESPASPPPDPSRLLVGGVQDHAIYMVDLRGTIVTWNPGVERVLGYSEAEWVGQHTGVIFTHEDREKGEPEEEMNRAAREGRTADVRWHVRKDGSRFWAEGSAAALRDASGALLGFGKVMADATQRKLAEDALRASEERYRTLVESIDVGFCVIEVLFDAEERPVDYRFLEANPAFERHTGLVGAVGRTAREVVPDLDGFWFQTYGRVALTGEATRFENHAPAMHRWFDVYALRVGAPEERRVALLFTDITARKQAEDALRASEERERARLTDIFMQAPAIMGAMRGPDHVLEVANPPFFRLVGHGRDILGKPIAEGLPEVVEQGLVGLLDRVYQTGEPFVGSGVPVLLRRTPDGPLEERFLDFTYQPLRDADGRITGVLSHGIDLTERARAETELRRELQVRDAITSTAADALFLMDAQGRITFANPAAEQMFGWAQDEMYGRVLHDLIHHHRADGTPYPLSECPLGEVLRDGETLRGHEDTFIRKDGSPVPIQCSNAALYTDGAISGSVLVVSDISERKRADAERERLLALERARADQERAHAAREAVLARIGAAVRSAIPPAEVQAVAVEALGRALGVDRCYFSTVDVERDQTVIGCDFHAEGVPPFAGTYRISDFDVDAAQIFVGGRTVAVPDTQDIAAAWAAGLPWSERTAAALSAMRARALVNVPFHDAGGRIVGALGVAMADAPRSWTPEEVAFIERVATETREAMDVIRRQQRERNIAEQLQEVLTPPAPPQLPGLSLASHYRPALAEAGVGGDFFDVFSVEEDCTALVVADLSGKGLAAAQQVATVRNMLRFALYNGHSVSEAISHLHKSLVKHDLLTGFATLFVGLYDHAERTLTYVNCGQEPGLIWRAATGGVEQLRPTGSVLGGFGEGAFEQAMVPLTSGDVLALFTDGLTEVGPSRKQLLEVEGVGDLLRSCCSVMADTRSAADPQAVVDRLIAEVDAFSRGGLRDDIALLVGVVGSDERRTCVGGSGSGSGSG